MVFVVRALLVLGRAGGWFAVPTAWRYAQMGYSSIALPPARVPLIAIGLAVMLGVKRLHGSRAPGFDQAPTSAPQQLEVGVAATSPDPAPPMETNQQ